MLAVIGVGVAMVSGGGGDADELVETFVEGDATATEKLVIIDVRGVLMRALVSGSAAVPGTWTVSWAWWACTSATVTWTIHARTSTPSFSVVQPRLFTT